MPPSQPFPEKTSPAPKRGDRIATILFRILIGAFGLTVLVFCLYMGMDWKTYVGGAAFFALLLGYAFGGDKWGARLYNILNGYRHKIPEEPIRPLRRKPPSSSLTDPP